MAMEKIITGISNGVNHVAKMVDKSFEALNKNIETISLDSTTDSKVKSLLEKYPSISKDDKLLINFLINNPDCNYIGTKKIQLGTFSSIETFEIWDSKNQLTYYIDKNYSNEYIFNETVKDINEIYSKNPVLIKNISEVVFTTKDCPSDWYWNLFGRSGKVSSTGGISDKKWGKPRITFYQEWENEYVGRNSQYGDANYIIAHEAAHCYDYGSDIRKHISDNQEWDNAMKADRIVQVKYAEEYGYNYLIDSEKSYVSQYSMDSYNNRNNNMRNDEEFADSIALISTNGKDYFEFNFPNRANLLRKICPELYNSFK
ncbi:MAG: hypothetical protein E7166_01095 [Firmicutes bacterium]|nr:hypothetical protein [Bacillota bacterium]